MSFVNFYGKDGNLSSTRIGDAFKATTSYSFDPNRGGTTIKGPFMTTRLNNRGQCIGIGLKNGTHTTYFNKDMGTVSRLTQF